MGSFGSQPGNIKAGIGPGINKCCYQVEKDVIKTLSNQGTIDNFVWKPGDREKLYLDLKKLIFFQLIECGLKKDNVEVAAECTCCNAELFFSHRRDNGKTGRMAALIGLKG
ncbi:MAG: polyphenol oxidase family protein [Deltaproteobacteria bacterium]|nr:polyphenol oxidase family protein [Deltaproteobacteria bacterium]